MAKFGDRGAMIVLVRSSRLGGALFDAARLRTVRHTLLIVGASAAALAACDSSTEPSGSRIDRLEIHLTPVRASYPVPDTVRASVVALSRDGTLVPTTTTTWRSLSPTRASVSASGLIQTLAAGEATIEVEVDGVTARLQIPIRGVLHTSHIDVSEIWPVADTPHVVRGYLNVGGTFSINATDTAVLTLEPGVIVRFRPRSGLYFGDIEPGALVIAAGAPGVVMEGDSAVRGSWVGLSFEGPGRSELRNLTLRHCGARTPHDTAIACLAASGRFAGSGPRLVIDNVTITDAHDGVSISHWVTIAPGSRTLSIENTQGYTATISPQAVGTFPRGGRFSGNSENEIRITNGLVEQSAEWTAAGLPWRLTGGVTFSGPANPVLALPAGLSIRSDPAGSLTFESGGLVAGAVGGQPVVLESTGSGWGGIATAHGGQSVLRNVILRECGSTTAACVRVDNDTDAGILMQDVVIRGARSTGIHFGTGGQFTSDSRNITITESAGVPLDVTPEGVTSIPTGNYRGNGTDAIRVRIGLIGRTSTWRNLGVPYLAPSGLRINASIIPPIPTLTLEPGVVVRMGVGTTLIVDFGALYAVGTAAEPIVFTSVTPGVPGSWVGIELESWESPAMRLEHVEIADAGAGPPGYAGALRLGVDPGGLLRNSIIRRSSSCGVILLGGEWQDDYSNPAFGNSFVDVAGPALCQPPGGP